MGLNICLVDQPGGSPGGAKYLPVSGREGGPLIVQTSRVEGVIEGVMVEDTGMEKDFIVEDRGRRWLGKGEWEGVFFGPGGGDPNLLGGVRKPDIPRLEPLRLLGDVGLNVGVGIIFR